MKPTREHKGRSLLRFPEDYTVIDIETTGLTADSAEIIEISAIRYRHFQQEAVFSTLIKPKRRINRFITDLTGITNAMVRDAPGIPDALTAFQEFIGEDILLGYNVHFDINFLYDNLMLHKQMPLTNDFVDVLRLARKALPQLENRKQTTVARYYGISVEGAHRAQKDCEICHACYLHLMQEAVFHTHQ